MAHYCFYISKFISPWVDKKLLNAKVRSLDPENRPKPKVTTQPLLSAGDLEQTQRNRSSSF